MYLSGTSILSARNRVTDISCAFVHVACLRLFSASNGGVTYRMCTWYVYIYIPCMSHHHAFDFLPALSVGVISRYRFYRFIGLRYGGYDRYVVARWFYPLETGWHIIWYDMCAEQGVECCWLIPLETAEWYTRIPGTIYLMYHIWWDFLVGLVLFRFHSSWNDVW